MKKKKKTSPASCWMNIKYFTKAKFFFNFIFHNTNTFFTRLRKINT
jgi:hypothetical protein